MTNPLTPLTSAELADLKAKAKAATRGPWVAGKPYDDESGTVGVGPFDVAYHYEDTICECWDGNHAAKNNAAHIAAANPETILRLIDMVERRDEKIEKLRKASSALTLRLREIENSLSYRGIWPFLYAHNYTYNGPDWHVQLKELEDILCPPSESLAATEPLK